jgi:hypothetical protein
MQAMQGVGNTVNNAFGAYQKGQDFQYQQAQRNFFQNPQYAQQLQELMKGYPQLFTSMVQQEGIPGLAPFMQQLLAGQGAKITQDALSPNGGQQPQTNTGPGTSNAAASPANIHGDFGNQPRQTAGNDYGGLNRIAADTGTDLDAFLTAYPKFKTYMDQESLSPGQDKLARAAMTKFNGGVQGGSSPDRGGDNAVAQAGTGNEITPSGTGGSSAQSPRQTGERRIAQNARAPQAPQPTGGYQAPTEQEIASEEARAIRARNAAADPRVDAGRRELLEKTAEEAAAKAKQLRDQRREVLGPTEKEKDLARGTTKAAEQTATDVKYYDSLHHGHTGTGFIAAQQKQNIDMLRQVAENQNFTPGAGSHLALLYQRAAAQLGINPTGAAPRELFDQVASRILADQFSGMKTMAAETGEAGARVFKSMLDIEEKAIPSADDSLEGIKSKLNFLDKTGDLFKKWADRADEYKLLHGSLDANFEKQMRSDIAKSRLDNVLPKESSKASASKPSGPGGWQEIAPGVRIREKPSADLRS